MSRGNYHLTIATTPEALTEDDVTPWPPGKARELTDRVMSSGPFLNLIKWSSVLFFSNMA